jgi:hypothetical protein
MRFSLALSSDWDHVPRFLIQLGYDQVDREPPVEFKDNHHSRIPVCGAGWVREFRDVVHVPRCRLLAAMEREEMGLLGIPT